MKKLLLTLTAIAGLTFASNAQDFGFGKGNFLLEGSFSSKNTNNKNTDVKTSNFNFSPKAGYFVTDNIAVGVELGFGQLKETTQPTAGETIDKTKTFNVGAFGRYYFLEVGSRFRPYAELGVGYDNLQSELKVAGNTTKAPKVNGFGADARIGANYFLTEKIAVNFAFGNVLGFRSSKVDVDGAKATTEFESNLNVFNNFFDTAQFGLTFKF